MLGKVIKNLEIMTFQNVYLGGDLRYQDKISSGQEALKILNYQNIKESLKNNKKIHHDLMTFFKPNLS